MKKTLHIARCLLALGIITLIMPVGYASAAACVPVISGMTAWWPGDDNSFDVIIGNHGVLRGTGKFGPGKVGRAFQFNGSGWFEVPDNPLWTLGKRDFTIELWAKFDGLTGLDPLIAHDEGSGPQDKWIFWYNPSGHDKLQGTPALRFMMNTQPLNGHDVVVAPWTPVIGQWYHLAVTRNGDTYRLYINGSQAAADTSPGEIPDVNAPLTIGKAEAFRLNGLVDEPTIYAHALSSQDISDIYEAGGFGKCKDGVSIPEYGWVSGGVAVATGICIIAFVRKRFIPAMDD